MGGGNGSEPAKDGERREAHVELSIALSESAEGKVTKPGSTDTGGGPLNARGNGMIKVFFTVFVPAWLIRRRSPCDYC